MLKCIIFLAVVCTAVASDTRQSRGNDPISDDDVLTQILTEGGTTTHPVLEAGAHGIVDVDTTTQPPVVTPSFDSSQWLPDPANANYVKRVGWRCTPSPHGATWSHNSIGPVYRDCLANSPGPCLGFSRPRGGMSTAVTDLSNCVQDWRFTTYLKLSSLPTSAPTAPPVTQSPVVTPSLDSSDSSDEATTSEAIQLVTPLATGEESHRGGGHATA